MNFLNYSIIIFLICVQGVFTFNNLEALDNKLHSLSLKELDDNLKPPRKHCKDFLREFQEQCKNFTICAMQNSVPVQLCINCTKSYFKVLDSYKNLTTFVEEITGKRCKEQYFDQDRLNIVESFYENLKGLWNRANCDECINRNHTINDQTNATLIKLKNLDSCIKKNSNACLNCNTMYMDLNEFYNDVVKKKENNKVCFDVQDRMNRTRSKWSKELKCCQREINLTAFSVVSSAFACIPILFYVGMYFYTKRQEANQIGILTDAESLDPSNGGTHIIRNQSEDANHAEPGPSSEAIEESNINPLNKNKTKKKIKMNNPEIISTYDDDDDESLILERNESKIIPNDETQSAQNDIPTINETKIISIDEVLSTDSDILPIANKKILENINVFDEAETKEKVPNKELNIRINESEDDNDDAMIKFIDQK